MSLQRIDWTDVSAGYGATLVLEEIALSLKAGEKLGVIGRNGAGKTTLLSAMTGAAKVSRGQVSADGRVLNGMAPHLRARLGIGIVPQTRDIFRSLTVRENLLAGQRGADPEPLSAAIEIFPRLGERLENLGGNLSGGEQQMLSIARALMGRPDFLLLDEPLEGLSPVVGQEVMAAVRRLVAERNLGCILVEQHVNTVLDFCDRVLVLQRGRTMFCGPIADLRAQPEILDAAVGLGRAA